MGTLPTVDTTQVGPRYATAAEWAVTPLVLARWEQGWATDTGVVKIGDGERRWPDLPVAMIPSATIDPSSPQAPPTGDGLSLVVLAEAAMQ